MNSSFTKKQYFLRVEKQAIQTTLELLNSDHAKSLGISRDIGVKIVKSDQKGVFFIPIQFINTSKIEKDIQMLHKTSAFEFSLVRLPWDSSWELIRPNTDLHENLRLKIPANVIPLIPKSFDVIGNIAIIDIDRWGELSGILTEEEFQKILSIVGQTILSLHKNIKTVLRKAGNIDGEFRIREYDLIAGKKNTRTIHRENEVSLFVDPTKMFFSSRLSFERKRVSMLHFKKKQIIIDCFAGCGPFSIQIAKNNDVNIFGIEKNPDAFKYFQDSIQLNKNKLKGSIKPFLGDFQDFHGSTYGKTCKNNTDYIIMNLPERSLEFLPHIKPFIKKDGTVLLFYILLKSDHSMEDAVTQLYDNLSECDIEMVKIHQQRIVFSYSPNQNNVGIDVTIKK